MSKSASRFKRATSLAGQGFLLLITSSSIFAVLFIFYFIIKDAIPFFSIRGIGELFTSTKWYPTGDPEQFGALTLIVGSGVVTVGAVIFAVLLGVPAAVCLSDVLPFRFRQYVKPVIEMLAAIPSVAYGFFALVVFAPLLQNRGGTLLSIVTWCVGIPFGALLVFILSDITTTRLSDKKRKTGQLIVAAGLAVIAFLLLYWLSSSLAGLRISSGTNVLNVSIILGIMALPTVVSVSEDALQAVGRELREGSYAVGATRAETLLKVIIPAAKSGIAAAIILGVMRAFGETMVVMMAAGNAAQIPEPIYNVLEPVRTITATIALEMGETDQSSGAAHYHALFALALILLVFSFVCNFVSEWVMQRSRKKWGV